MLSNEFVDRVTFSENLQQFNISSLPEHGDDEVNQQ